MPDTEPTPAPTAPNLARLAREIAMDILPLHDVLEMHKLDFETWEKIQKDPRFDAMLSSMIVDWGSANNVKRRVQVKAATGFEALMEGFIEEARRPDVPLVQKIELGKLLVRIGELEADKTIGGGGGQVLIQINMGLPEPAVNVVANIEPVKTIPSRDAEDV